MLVTKLICHGHKKNSERDLVTVCSNTNEREELNRYKTVFITLFLISKSENN